MNKDNIHLILYYIVLLLIFASRQGDMAPSMPIRIAFMSAAILPSVLSKEVSYPAVLTLFFTLTLYGFAYSYMPYTLSLYVFVTLILTVIITRRAKPIVKTPLFSYLFPVYVFCVDSINSFGSFNASYVTEVLFCLVMLLCYFLMAISDESISLKQLPLAFMAVSVVLSLYFILNRETFVVNYDYNGEYERIGWIDPNYFGTVLGMGVVIAFNRLIGSPRQRNKQDKLDFIFCISTIILATPVLLLNASRGAILSVVVAVVVSFVSAKARTWQKALIMIVATIGIVYLYNNQYMDLLAYRISNDDTGGSGRLPIWISKLTAYSHGNLINILFGYGYSQGLTISGRFIGFHNDFLAFLVDYGIVGFFLFIHMLLYPILRIPRKSSYFPYILSIIAYLSVTCFTLEPLTAGRLPYYTFYLFALLLAIYPKAN